MYVKLVIVCFMTSCALGLAVSRLEDVPNEHAPNKNQPHLNTNVDVFLDRKDANGGESSSSDDVDNVDPINSDNKSEEDIDVQEKRRYYGSVLGRGLSFGKRFGYVLGHGFSMGKRFGHVLGNGFSFGKRYQTDDTKHEDFAKTVTEPEDSDNLNPPVDDDNDISKDLESVDLDGPVDDKKWVIGDIYGGGFHNYKRSKRDVRKKRFIHYFGNMLGRGFTLGRRNSERYLNRYPPDDEYFTENEDNNGNVEKRFWRSGVLGRGYMFGKRWGSPRNRYFGSVLGRGFAFGKRDSGMGPSPDEKYFELEDSRDENDYNPEEGAEDVSSDEDISTDEDDDVDPRYHDKRYFLSSPGHRFLFGKGKRFGHVLGRGFSFGKRSWFPTHDTHDMKRPYGLVLGHEFSLGKRSHEYFDDVPPVDNRYFTPDLEDMPDDNDKRSGYLLGKGYMFGNFGNRNMPGYGPLFEKRSYGPGPNADLDNSVDLFVDPHGDVYVPTEEIGFSGHSGKAVSFSGCNGDIVPEYYSELFGPENDDGEQLGPAEGLSSQPDEVRYFIDPYGNVFVRVNDVPYLKKPELFRDDPVLICAGDMFDINLDNSDDMSGEIDKRSFGHVLGRGFRFGKRFDSWKRFGHVLGHGYAFGK